MGPYEDTALWHANAAGRLFGLAFETITFDRRELSYPRLLNEFHAGVAILRRHFTNEESEAMRACGEDCGLRVYARCLLKVRNAACRYDCWKSAFSSVVGAGHGSGRAPL